MNHNLGRKTVYCSPDCREAFRIIDLRVRQKRFYERKARFDKIRNSTYATMLAIKSKQSGNVTMFYSWARHEFNDNITTEELERIVNMLCGGENGK